MTIQNDCQTQILSGQMVILAGYCRMTGRYSSSETQGLLVGTMRYFPASDIFAQKFISRAEKPLGTLSYQTISRSVEIRPADWPEKYFSGQSTRRSSRITLSPFYTKWFSSSIKREDSREEFKKNKKLQLAYTHAQDVTSCIKKVPYAYMLDKQFESLCHLTTRNKLYKKNANSEKKIQHSLRT